MGLFSWDCPLCGASLHRVCGKRDPDAWQADALLFAANGVTAEGRYDGYGRIGSFKIPGEWDGGDEVRGWERMIADRAAWAVREAEINALIREIRADVGPEPSPPKTDDSDLNAELEKARAALVEFTVYHRRCWEAAGRPGFAGQSKYARDQGR